MIAASASLAGSTEAHPLATLAASAGRWWRFDQLLLLADRPGREVFDAGRERVHATDGPAIDDGDGWRVWAVDGVMVPRGVVEALGTVAGIQAEPDAEVRAIMLRRFGYERYLLEAGMTEVHRDRFGVLYRAEVPGDEPLVMVDVRNATGEPDGGVRRYLLRVPPTVVTAHAAVAWTFRLPPSRYDPWLET